MKIQTEYAKTLVDNGDYYICFKLSQYHMNEAVKFCAENCVPWEKQKTFDVEVKEHREKRSLDANAYCFVLLDKLSEKLGIPKTELYRTYVREVGGNSETVCVRTEAVDKLRRGWEHNGLGWVTDSFPSKIDGCTNVVLYYGSSVYDTKQMSRLIDMVVFDCKTEGIETMTPAELESLTERWGR